ncbi:MAG: hypothetical protein WD206_02415 [Actinomycetota bacterium]
MKKRLGPALVAGAFMTLLLPGVASAAPPEGAKGPPMGRCPTNWITADPQEGHPAEAYDFNGDGFVCGLPLPGGGFALMDNVIR